MAKPLVSVVMTTHERPHLLPIALRCYAEQRYAQRELIVVDDGVRYPAREELVRRFGGRLLRVPPGTTLGAKLNLGLELLNGAYCQKMDDDDWFAPDFLVRMVHASTRARATSTGGIVAAPSPVLFFDVARWELRLSEDERISGAALHFTRDAWKAHPFRDVMTGDDTYFVRDNLVSGGHLMRVQALESHMLIRHTGHLWTDAPGGRSMDSYLASLPRYPARPEALLPEWALRHYRTLHAELTASSAAATLPT